MTPELQRRLEASLPPFDGVCVQNPDVLRLSQLREVLSRAVSLLSPHFRDIHSFRDWHEHDGYIVKSKVDSWGALNAATANDWTLFDSRDDDFGVRIAYFPTSFEWLLRYNIDQNDESNFEDASCDFDLSVARGTGATDVVADLLTRFGNLLTKHDSSGWFASKYGG